MTTFKWHAATPLTESDARQFWEVRYEHDVTPWDRGNPSPALTHWLDAGALTPCRILIPGCGRGYEVVELARRGFDVTAIDFAPRAIEAVTGKLDAAGVTATLVQTDFFRWRPDVPFAAIYEQTALCALLPAQWSAYERRLAQWLAPEGRLFALFMQTKRQGGPPFHCDIEAMRELFGTESWLWPDSEPESVAHSTGFFELGAVLERN